MVVGIGEALIAANLLGISAIASMWKDPNAVRTAAGVNKGKWSGSEFTSSSATNKFMTLEEKRAAELEVKIRDAEMVVAKQLKVLNDAEKELKLKNAASATIKKQFKDMQTLFPKATDQLATLTKQMSQAESDAAAAFLAVGTARAAYDQALEDLGALTPPSVTNPPSALDRPVRAGPGGAGPGGAGPGGDGPGGDGAGGAGPGGAGPGGAGPGGAGPGGAGPGGAGPGGAGPGGAGPGLDTTARDAERARVEELVHAIHPDAVVSINAEGGQQVIVGGSEVWTIVPTGEGVQFKAAGTEGTVPSIPGLATSQGPVEDQARLAAEAEAAAEQARLAEAYARASAEAEAEAKAGVRAAEQAALAQTAAEAEQARLAAEAGAAPATPVLGPAQPPSPGGFTLGTESDGSESEHRDRASSIQSTAPRTTWDTPEMPYLLKNGHPNPGFVLRFLQAYDAAPDNDQELRTLRDSFDKWWDQPADIGVKRALESWKDNSGQNYVGQRKNTDKFMDAVTRARVVDRNEPSIAAAIENVPLARGDSLSTLSQSDAGELNETSQYPSSATRTVPAPESPGSAPASPLPPVQMPPLPEPETPEESVRRLLREGQARTAEVAALASGNQAAQAAAANSIADRPAVRRPPLQELLASIPAGDTPEARDATERLREGIAARASAVNAQTEAAVNAASARRVTGSNEPLVKALLHRDPFGLNPAIERQLTRRGRGRKSTFRKKRKNKK